MTTPDLRPEISGLPRNPQGRLNVAGLLPPAGCSVPDRRDPKVQAMLDSAKTTRTLDAPLRVFVVEAGLALADFDSYLRWWVYRFCGDTRMDWIKPEWIELVDPPSQDGGNPTVEPATGLVCKLSSSPEDTAGHQLGMRLFDPPAPELDEFDDREDNIDVDPTEPVEASASPADEGVDHFADDWRFDDVPVNPKTQLVAEPIAPDGSKDAVVPASKDQPGDEDDHLTPFVSPLADADEETSARLNGEPVPVSSPPPEVPAEDQRVVSASVAPPEMTGDAQAGRHGNDGSGDEFEPFADDRPLLNPTASAEDDVGAKGHDIDVPAGRDQPGDAEDDHLPVANLLGASPDDPAPTECQPSEVPADDPFDGAPAIEPLAAPMATVEKAAGAAGPDDRLALGLASSVPAVNPDDAQVGSHNADPGCVEKPATRARERTADKRVASTDVEAAARAVVAAPPVEPEKLVDPASLTPNTQSAKPESGTTPPLVGDDSNEGAADAKAGAPESTASAPTPTENVPLPKRPARYETHPAASIFPMMNDDDLASLAADVRERGLVEPVVLLDCKVLDGRNRLRACELAGVEPGFVEWGGAGDPAAWVLSKNLRRRHLTEAQRAMVGARLKDHYAVEAKARMHSGGRTDPAANLRQGAANTSMSAPETKSEAGRSAEKAAATLNVSPRSVESAARILRDAPALAPLVDQGALSVSAAAAAVALPSAARDALVAQVTAAQTPAEAKKLAQGVLRSHRVEKKTVVISTAEIDTGPTATPGAAGDLARNDDPEVDGPARAVDDDRVFEMVDAMVDSETRELLEHLDDLAAFDPAWAEKRRDEVLKALASWSARRASVA